MKQKEKLMMVILMKTINKFIIYTIVLFKNLVSIQKY